MKKKAINVIVLTSVAAILVATVYYFGKQAIHFIIKMHGGS